MTLNSDFFLKKFGAKYTPLKNPQKTPEGIVKTCWFPGGAGALTTPNVPLKMCFDNFSGFAEIDRSFGVIFDLFFQNISLTNKNF